jgi:hypothetical protein
MLGTPLFAALCLGLLLPGPRVVSAQALVPAANPPTAPIIEAQWRGEEGDPEWGGRREHCDRMRPVVQAIGEQLQHAPPWERDDMGARFHQMRERMRHECWRG